MAETKITENGKKSALIQARETQDAFVIMIFESLDNSTVKFTAIFKLIYLSSFI